MSDQLIELEGLILEDQLLDHLGTPEGCMAVYAERFDPDILPDDQVKLKKILVWVMDYIREHGSPPAVELLAYEHAMEEFMVPKAPIAFVIDRLRQQHIRNQMRRAVTKTSRLVQTDPHEALRLGLEEFQHVQAQTISRSIVCEATDIGEVLERYEERQRLGLHNGITYGFVEIDRVLGGLRTGCLYFVIARPKRYKSWFLLKSAAEALLSGKSTAFFSLEMDKKEMQERIGCMLAEVSWSAFLSGGLMPADKKRFEDVSKWMNDSDAKCRLYKPPRGQRTVQHMLQYAKELPNCEVVYVDQLSFIESTKKGAIDQRWREVGFICEDLKDACDTLPFYVAAQFNREAANLAEMADLSKIGLSDAIGQTADLLFGIHQTREMKDAAILQFGTIESRSYEHALWEIKVELSKHSNFRVLGRISSD